MGTPDHLTCLLRNLYAGQEATVKPDLEQWTVSKLGKEHVKAVYCHLTYLTYMQSESENCSVVSDFVTSWAVVHGILQARILEWVAVPSPGDLPNPGIEPRSPTLQEDSLPAETQGKSLHHEKCRAEAQVGIRTVGRNINNFWYADDTTVMAESEEELWNLLMKLKEDN